MDGAIGPLRRHQVPAAAKLLSQAFADDGIISHYFSGARGVFAYRALFRSVLHDHLGRDAVDAATMPDRRLAGVAIWAPPEADSAPRRARFRARLSIGEVRALFPVQSVQLLNGLRRLDDARPDEAHWLLEFVGVDPAQQGEGIGAAVLAPGLARVDATGMPCVLETPFPQTHAFYRRLGFEIVASVEPFPGLRPLSVMVRPARGSRR